MEEYKSKFKHELFAFTLDGKTDLEDLTPKSPYTLIFGNEGSGLSEEYQQKANTIKIRQSNNIDSLNLSVAVGIVLYRVSLID